MGFMTDHVENLLTEIERLRAAIRKHRDQRGDDRCWQDDRELYGVLPEGFTPPAEDSAVELENCKRYIASRHDPQTVYCSPQRKIEELENRIKQLEVENAELARRAAWANYD